MNQSLPIPNEFQNSIVFGYMLGDGYLYKDGRLQVEQGFSQKEFVEWLYNKLKNLTSGEIKLAEKTHSRTGEISYSWRFYTKKVFKKLESLFYIRSDNKMSRILPEKLGDYLNPVVLAVWFMCDGTKYLSGPKGAYINATSFSLKQRFQIQQVLSEVFELTINLHNAGVSKTGKKQYNFYVTADSYDQFYKIVYPIISQVPSLLYKLKT